MKKTTAKKEIPASKPEEKKNPVKKVINVEKPKSIRSALFNFQQEHLVLPRNGSGKASSGKTYKYVTLDDMIQIAGPVLQKYGIGFTQLVQTDKMETKLFHADSDTELMSVINLGSPNNMQDYGGRITYAKRYALGAILGLSSEEDLDETPIPEEKPDHAITTPKGEVMTSKDNDIVAKNNEAMEAISKPHVQRSEFFLKAKGAVDTAFSAEALEMIKGQIDRSTRLNDTEKVELKEILIARETEIEGTVR